MPSLLTLCDVKTLKIDGVPQIYMDFEFISEKVLLSVPI